MIALDRSQRKRADRSAALPVDGGGGGGGIIRKTSDMVHVGDG